MCHLNLNVLDVRSSGESFNSFGGVSNESENAFFNVFLCTLDRCGGIFPRLSVGRLVELLQHLQMHAKCVFKNPYDRWTSDKGLHGGFTW